jgi:hypothetical protein
MMIGAMVIIKCVHGQSLLISISIMIKYHVMLGVVIRSGRSAT